MSNAIKFTPKGGKVTVHAGLDQGGGIYISVDDTGIGIAPEDIPRIVEPFGQVRNSPEQAHEGTGLGLSLSIKFLELHGGTLSIHSKVGHGTTMKISFPPERSIHSN